MYLTLRFYIGPGTSSTITTNGGGGGVVAATRGIAAEFSLLAYVKSTAAKLTGYGRVSPDLIKYGYRAVSPGFEI